MKCFLCCCFFVCLAVSGVGQSSSLVFKHLNRSSGLPVDEVICVAQDSAGFVWLGTPEGLFRYDGFTYQKFYEPGNVKAALNNRIANICIDNKGFIWVTVAYSGIVVLTSSGEVLDVLNSSVLPSFTGDRSNKIVQDQNHRIWCSSENGLFQLAIRNDKIQVEKKVDLLRLGHTTNITGNFVFDQKGRTWLCTYTGLVIYDPANNQLYNRRNNPEQIALLNDTTPSANIFRDENGGKIWYNNWLPCLEVYDEKTHAAKVLYNGRNALKKDYSWMVHRFYTDGHNRLWIGTDRGLLLVGKDGNGIERSFVNEPANNFSIASNVVLDIHEDREGSFWLATANGISLASPYGENFHNLSTNAVNDFPFGNKQVNAIIHIDTATFLVGTYGADGLYETDRHFRVKRHVAFHNNDYDWVWASYKDEKNGQVYISTQKGMLRYNCSTHAVEKLTGPPFDRFFPVTAFLPDKDGTVWMARYRDEIIRYAPASGSFTVFSLPKLGLAPQVIRMAADAGNNLWIIGLNSGLFRFDKKQQKIVEKITRQANNPQSLLQTEIILFRDVGAYFLLGYDQKGFSIYHKKTKTFEHFATANGLAGNRVSDAWSDNEGNVWLATSNGISVLRLATRQLVTYNYESGILNNDVHMLTPMPDGRLAAGTTKGFFVFDPDAVEKQTLVPPPVITGVNIYGRKIPVGSFLTRGASVQVPYRENYIAVDFISLQYSRRQQIEYSYQLKGFDKTWVAAGSRRYASYANLPGGSYTLNLRARLPGGDWVESKFPLSITVQTPFYRQWWFMPSCALLVLLIAFALFRYRVHQLLRMERFRSTVSSDLHDEVGATLSSISIFSEMAKQSVSEDAVTRQYLQRIGERSRESIEKMGDIIWSINPENDSLQQLLLKMKAFVNELSEASDFQVKWQENGPVSTLKLDMEQRKNFYLLFKEAVNNAVKYAAAKNLFVDVAVAKKSLRLAVRDDGKGFDPHAVRMGNGIKNMHQRAAALNGHLELESVPGAGTAVTLRLPV